MADATHNQLIESVRSYRMPDEAAELLTKYNPMIIVGVTASGKGSVASYLSENSDFAHVVTHTTRQPRHGEAAGKDYWFVSEEQMLKLLEENAMIEAKAVHGHAIYGTSIKAYKSVIDAGHKPFLIIDVQGVEEIAKRVSPITAAFLLPPSFEAWMERLDKRGAMSHVERARRLQSSRTEIERAMQSRHFTLFVNRDINSTAQSMLDNITNPSEQHRNRELAKQLLDHIRHY